MGNILKLSLFDRWMDPVGAKHLRQHDPALDITTLSLADDDATNWAGLSTSHGYQLLPSTETPAAFYPGERFLERCPNLLAIASAGAGYDIVDVEACTKKGILVFNQSGANSESVVQHTLGMMLALCKQMIQSDRAIHRPGRDWNRMNYIGTELTGRTLGIVGLGNVGRRLSALCGPNFKMRVIAYDPYLSEQDFEERGAEKADLNTVMSQSDFVSIHCPLTQETNGMISERHFQAMKPGAFFISTARGGIHDETALEKVISAGLIAGAGLDVFAEEPPSHTHPLLAYPNVIVSPHNAGITSDCLYNMALSAAEQWVQVFAGDRPRLLVNPGAYQKFTQRFAQLLGNSV